MKVLVVGAAGQLGQAMSARLVGEHQVLRVEDDPGGIAIAPLHFAGKTTRDGRECGFVGWHGAMMMRRFRTRQAACFACVSRAKANAASPATSHTSISVKPPE